MRDESARTMRRVEKYSDALAYVWSLKNGAVPEHDRTIPNDAIIRAECVIIRAAGNARGEILRRAGERLRKQMHA